MVNLKQIEVGTPARSRNANQHDAGERTPDMIRSYLITAYRSTGPPIGLNLPRHMGPAVRGFTGVRTVNAFGSAAGTSSVSGLEDPFGPQPVPANSKHAQAAGDTIAVANAETQDMERPAKRRRKVNLQPLPQLRRYSHRTQSKPATSMNRVWHLLPAELRELIWEMALDDPLEMRRIVYIRNRNTPSFPIYPRHSISANYTVPTGSSISLACAESRAVYLRKFFEVYQQNYRSMFSRFKAHLGGLQRMTIENTLSRESLQSEAPANLPNKVVSLTDAEFWACRYTLPEQTVPLAPKSDVTSNVKAKVTHPPDSVIGQLDTVEQQPVNPEIDIIYIEPCCDGCRGQHCISRQFLSIDRNAVRFLVVKDEPLWPPMRGRIPACWETLTKVFPNVEIMYIDINNPGPPYSTIGETKQRRVMVRVKDTAHDRIMVHQSRFADWKDGEGKNVKLAKIEFVAVYEHKKPQINRPDGDQYPLALREGRRHKLADNVFIVR